MRSEKIGVLVLGFACALASGCGGDGGENGGGGGTGGGFDNQPPPVTSGQTCSDVQFGAAQSVRDQRGGGMPTLNGGQIQDGTYYLTRYQWHKPDNALHTRRTVMVVSNGQFSWMGQRVNEGASRLSGTVSGSGNTLDIQMACPSAGPFGWDQYHVDGNTLIFHDVDDVKTATFQRQ